MAQINALEAEMTSAEALVLSARLTEPDTATVVREAGGEVAISTMSLSSSRRSTSVGSISSRWTISTPRCRGRRRRPPSSGRRSRSELCRTPAGRDWGPTTWAS